MTCRESAGLLQQFAKDVGNQDVPVYFCDRAFRQPLSKAAGSMADYLEQFAKNPPDEPAMSRLATGVACPVLDVVAGQMEDGRKCVILEYDSVGAP